jgi:hypothetical protein
MAVRLTRIVGAARTAGTSDVTLEIAPYTLEASPKHQG